MANESTRFPSPYQFKIDVDVKKSKGRPLFQAFGKTIYKAEWVSKREQQIVLVKIHGAKATREAAFYVNLSCHPHIVRTYGLVESSVDSVMLVQERAVEGDLGERLREKEFRPKQAVLLEIFLQITEAMICLADNEIVHGDLACRNVLLYKFNEREPAQNLVKLTDFGLTRSSSLFSVVNSTVSTTLTIIPIRYAAPELIRDCDQPSHSEKSDVYSMGVLMWEALSQGQLPYESIESDEEVKRLVLTGKVLDKPDRCDDELWTIITQCWQQRVEDRPTFKTLKETLSALKFGSRPVHEKPTWRDIIPLDSNFDQTELADKIRQVYESSSGPSPKLVLDRDDKENIQRLCIKVCDPSLVEFLIKVNAVCHLPIFIRNYITSLNALARDVDKLELPNDGSNLKDMLKLRCTLLEADWFAEAIMDTGDDRTKRANDLLNKICDSHPDICSFQNLSYGQLKSDFLDLCTPKQYSILEKLWISNDNLRDLIQKYNLPLITVDWLHQQKVVRIEQLTDSHVNHLVTLDRDRARISYEQTSELQIRLNIANLHELFKANVRDLYQNEVQAQPTVYNDKVIQQRDSIRQALEEIQSVDRNTVFDKISLSQKLVDIGARLKMNWYISPEEKDKLNELFDTVIRDLHLFLEIMNASSTSEYIKDEDLVKCASGSTALHAMKFIEPDRKIFRPFLARPTFVSLEAPSIQPVLKEFTFPNLVDCTKFIRTIETSGMTAAVQMLSSADANFSMNTKSNLDGKQSKTFNTLVKIRCYIVPVKSLCISKEQMKLSPEAEAALNLVIDSTTARVFLSDFGSHISDGIQHIGGIFIYQLSAKADQKTSVEELEKAVDSEWNASLQIGYRTYRSHLPSISETDMNQASNETGNQHSISIQHTIQSIGPACENFELFQSILSSNTKSCCLIDRGSLSSFIPVWEIIDHRYSYNSQMHDTVELLKRTWLTETSDCASTEPLLLERDYVFLLQPTPIEYFQKTLPRVTKNTLSSSDLADQLKEQLKEYIDAMNINYDTIEDDELLKKVTDVIQKVIRASHQNWFDLLTQVTCQSPMKEFLSSIICCKNNNKFHKLQAYLQTVFSTRRRQHLGKSHVQLDAEFVKFLDQTILTDVKLDEQTLYLRQMKEYIDTPTVLLSELPKHLAQVIKNYGTKSAVSKTTLLIKKSLLEAQKNSQSDLDRRPGTLLNVLDVLIRFGWSTSKEDFSSKLIEDGLVALQKELNDVININFSAPSSESTPLVEQIGIIDASRKHAFMYQYSDWAVDRPLAPIDQFVKRLMDILRHRLDIKLFSPVPSSSQATFGTKAFTRNLLKKTASQNPSSGNTDTTIVTSNLVNNTVYDALIQLVDNSDVLSQVELFRLLLERRSLVPLLTPRRSDRPFSYHVKPLTFTDIKLSLNNYCNLSSNTELFRVAFISMRNPKESESREFLKQIFGCNSLISSYVGGLGSLPDHNCVAEIGVGFCPKTDEEQNKDKPASGYNELLILHTIGDYARIFPFIHDFADVFIVESHSDGSHSYRPLIPVKGNQEVIIWKSASVAKDPYRSDDSYIHLESTIAQAIEHVHPVIDELINESNTRSRLALQAMKYPTIYDGDSITWIDAEEEVKNQDYFKLRTTDLQLQQLFVGEVEHLRQKIQAQTTFAERETADYHIRACQRRRYELAPKIIKHPLLKCFVGVLSQTDEQLRTVGLCQFIKNLELYSKSALQELFQRQQAAHDEFNRNSQNNEKKNAYYEAKRIYAGSLVTTEHLWRELCHVYVSNTKRYANLPVLAAQHLLDGFSLELLDGDAGMMEQTWITAVFRELNLLVSKTGDNKSNNNNKEKKYPRILVLSVMGVQSSGKSTLLNLMFGTRLRASAGMCTRGVNIQLLKAEGRPEYDYVLILDTEGVRAPEFSGLQGATWRDNRLATFSILPADITIIMINNEEDTAAREILPIVMLAYQQSELAAKSTNQLKTKLFFVYTRIDTNDKIKLSGIAQSLSLELRKAAADLEQSQHHFSKQPNITDQVFASELLHDFRTEDIVFLGKLKVRDKPPEDVPEFDYGNDIVKLHTYIYDRLIKSSPSWQARDLSKFAEYLNVIWQCVQTVDFTLSFKTVLERWAYEDLQVYCRDMYGGLASLFSEQYDKLEPVILKTLDDSSLKAVDSDRMIEIFQTQFTVSVGEKAEEIRLEFISHVNQQKYWQAWSVDTKRDWQLFAEKQTTDVTFRIYQLVTSRLLFDQEFINYQKALRSKISESFEEKSQEERKNIVSDSSGQLKEFDDIFKAIIHSSNLQHPSINVEKEVCDVYTLHNIGKAFDFTENHREFKKKKLTKTGHSEVNFIRSIWKTVIEMFSKHNSRTSTEETKLLLELQDRLNHLLVPVKRYITQVPTEAIRITQKLLAENKIKREEVKRKAHQITYTQLVVQLTTIQNEWENNHSIAVRLIRARPNMWEYYKKTVQGIHGTNLLKSELISVFQRNLEHGFQTLLQQRVITDLTHETWIGNDQIVQAMLNLEIIELVEANEIIEAIRCLSNMGEHYTKKIDKLFRQKIEDLAQRCSDDYHKLLQQDIQEAITATMQYRNPECNSEETDAQRIRQGRTEFFLQTLSRSLLEHRFSRLSDDLNGLQTDSLAKCDSEDDQVWNEVGEEMKRGIPSKLMNDYLRKEDLDSLTKSIRDTLVNRYARGGATLRCSEPCPLCGSPCRAAAGHTIHPAEDRRRHDTDHQPSGLFGTYQDTTRELVPDSCSTNISRNFTFAYSNAHDQRSYSEFSTIFSDWKQPASLTTESNEVGQYVFYHYQNELAAYHKCKPCRKIPSSFNRSLAELKNKQERIIYGLISK